jgi:hypothetical protein
MKYKSLISDKVDVFFEGLDPIGKKQFLVDDLDLLKRWYDGSFYSIRSKYKPVKGIELAATKQEEFEALVRLLFRIRSFGSITPPARIFRLTKLSRKVKRDEMLQWNDPKAPLTSWTDDTVSMFRFSPENSMNTTAVSLEIEEPAKHVLMMDHFLMTEFLDYVKSKRNPWIKAATTIPEKQAISLKPQILQTVKDITTQLKGQREYLVYLPRGAKLEARVTGTLFTAA